MKNIKMIVDYMRKRSEELKGVSMVIPTSVMIWDKFADILDSYGWKTGSPENSGEYLCLSDTGWISVLSYSKKHDAFNAHDECCEASSKIDVIAWCELPEVPEELK